MASPAFQTDGAPLLRVRALTRAFGGRTVVGPLSFELPLGRRFALVGPNGSGKSTILRCIAGTLRPTSGEIAVGGHAAGTREAQSLLGVSLSQERSFDLRLSGHVNLVIFARLRGIPARDAEAYVRSLEDELELAAIASQRVANCSTGMTQQLSFARSLLADPRLLLLDEPTRSLDEDARARLWAALDRRSDVGVLVATHRDDDVERCGEVLEVVR